MSVLNLESVCAFMLWPEGEDKELGKIKGIGSPLWKMGKIGRGCVIKEVES